MTSDGWWKQDITCDNDCMPCLLQEDGWKLSRTNYYQEGWLATANVRGVVGVTYTTSFCAGTQVSPQAYLTMFGDVVHYSEKKAFIKEKAPAVECF